MEKKERLYTGDASKGWECPKCGRVISPYYPSCPYCVPGEERDTATWTMQFYGREDKS